MKSRRELYSETSPSPWAAYGQSGDGLLFASLLAVGQNREFPIEEAMDLESGKLFRNPGMRRGDVVLGPRDSTISRDMLMGFLTYCLHFRRLDLLDKTISYAIRHCGKMGEENRIDPIVLFGRTFLVKNNRTILTPGLFILMLAIRAFLRGRVVLSKVLINIPQLYSTEPGYVSHLTMLHLYLNRRMRGYLTEGEKRTLYSIGNHSSRNPLISALLGDRIATGYLTVCFPLNRLPDTHDWQEEWRTQRADGDSGFLANTNAEAKPHSGGDLLFCEHVLDGHQEQVPDGGVS